MEGGATTVPWSFLVRRLQIKQTLSQDAARNKKAHRPAKEPTPIPKILRGTTYTDTSSGVRKSTAQNSAPCLQYGAAVQQLAS